MRALPPTIVYWRCKRGKSLWHRQDNGHEIINTQIRCPDMPKGVMPTARRCGACKQSIPDVMVPSSAYECLFPLCERRLKI